MTHTPEKRVPTNLPSIPAPLDAEFQAGKRLYAEQWGDAVVTNTYLKLTILALCLLCAGSLYIARRRRPRKASTQAAPPSVIATIRLSATSKYTPKTLKS